MAAFGFADSPRRGRLRSRRARIGSRPVLSLGLFCVFAPLIGAVVIQNVDGVGKIALGAYDLGARPGHGHPLGVDGAGRDILAMLAYGLWPTLEVGLVAGASAAVIGTTLGLVAGYVRGLADWSLRAISDVLLGLPVLPILIVIAAFVGSVSVRTLGVIIGLVSWPFTMRVVRAQVLSMREAPYIEIARLSGASSPEILGREILPNLLPFVLAGFVGAVSAGILTSVGLQILGLGTFGTPTLGLMLEAAYEGGALSRGMWWWWGPPTILLIVIFVGLFLVSLAVDDIANPRLRGR